MLKKMNTLYRPRRYLRIRIDLKNRPAGPPRRYTIDRKTRPVRDGSHSRSLGVLASHVKIVKLLACVIGFR